MITATFIGCKNENAKADKSEIDTTDEVVSNNSKNMNSATDHIIDGYLKIKNALVNDNDKEAAESGKALEEAISGFDKSSLTQEQLNSYEDLAEDIKEHAEHIGHNSGNIEHQREHFVMLSNDMIDFVTTFGTSQKLFKFYCSMANENKGAVWLSETKEIGNPYLGSKMESCGEFQEEIPIK